MPDYYGDISRNFESLELAANSNPDPVDAAHILACLNAMQTRQQQLQQQGPDSIENFGLEFWLEKQLEIPFGF